MKRVWEGIRTSVKYWWNVFVLLTSQIWVSNTELVLLAPNLLPAWVHLPWVSLTPLSWQSLQGVFPESWQLALAYLLRTTLAFSFPSLHPALSIGIIAIKLSKRVSPPLRSACRPLTTVVLVSTAGGYPWVGPWGLEFYRSARYQIPLCYLQEYSGPIINTLTSNRQACASVSFLLCPLLKRLSWDCSGLPPTQGHVLLYI